MKDKILNCIGQDGLLQVVCCIIAVGVVDLFFPLWAAVAATAAIVAGKELVWGKLLGKGTSDKKALLCYVAGIIIGCL